jgi:rubredoxin
MWLLMLFIPPKRKEPSRWEEMQARNGVCPVCGAPGRKVEAVTKTTYPIKDGKPNAIRMALLEWSCQNCKAKTYTRTLAGDDADKIHGREMVGI